MDENRPETETEVIEDTEQSNIPPVDEETPDVQPEAPETPAAEEAPAQPAPKKKPAAPKKSPAPRKRKKRKRSKALSRILAVILTLLLIVLAVLVFVFRDELTAESLRQRFGRDTAVDPAREAFTYETGAEQVFAPAGNGLAVASSSSVQLLDEKGQTVYKQVVSFETPAVFSSGDGALFCDLSGTGCVVARLDGSGRDLSGERKILTADMNAAGWFALVTEEPGYKGLVSVYNAESEKQYEWWSGTSYVLRAAVSPDNKSLAVLSADKTGTLVRFFALNSEEQQAEFSYPDRLLYDLRYMDNGTLCAVGEKAVCFLGPDGTVKSEYDLNGKYLLDYAVSGEFVTLFTSSYRSGAGGTLLTLDRKGNPLGTAALERDVVSLSASGKQLLVMTGGGLVLYDDALVRQYANETLMTAKRAILRPNGDVLLLYAYSAERFRF